MRASIALALALTVLVTVAPSVARAEVEDTGLELTLASVDHRIGALSTPAFGGAGAFLVYTQVSSGQTRWFDRGWAIAELAAGLAGSAYSSWVLSDAVMSDRDAALPIATWTAGAALAMNLRLVTHAALSWALWDQGADPLVRGLVPTITVSPIEGGVMASLRWTT